MLVTDKLIYGFRIKEVWFADEPYDMRECDCLIFRECKNKVAKDTVAIRGFDCSEFTTLTIDLTQDLDKIWSGFSDKSCQYMIKRAKREQIDIKLVVSEDEYMQFYTMNSVFRDSKGLAQELGLDVYYLTRYGTLFLASANGEVIAGQAYLEGKDDMRWLLGASKRLETNVDNAVIGCANRALIWEAIQYAKQRGIKTFDFGGYYTGESNKELEAVNFFKKSFGGQIVTRYDYIKNYSKLYTIAQKVKHAISKN